MNSELAHEVVVPCNCGDAEHCKLSLYVSDVRIAWAEIQRLYRRLENIARVASA